MMDDMEAAKAAMGMQITTVNSAISDALFGTDDEDALPNASIPAVNVNRKEVPQEEIDRVALRNNPNVRCDPSIHASNKKWVRNRNKWRRQYHMVTDTIKFVKQDLKRFPSPQSQLMLIALQDKARQLMLDRLQIGYYLRSTAHPWV